MFVEAAIESCFKELFLEFVNVFSRRLGSV